MVSATASAPGKLVVLGEYAVLANAPALVMAVDRRCRAEIRPSDDALCHLRSLADCDRDVIFRPGVRSGVALVDRVSRDLADRTASGWRGVLDSSALYCDGRKLGLGSSAAALTAWSGAWLARLGDPDDPTDGSRLQDLIDRHRHHQGVAGSGIDVAASFHGGVIRFQLDSDSRAQIERAKLPAGVDLVGVFVRSSALTPRYVARFRERAAESPSSASFWIDALARLAEKGIGCALADDADGFLEAVRDYAGGLQALGEWMGAEIFTPEHVHVQKMAERRGVAYKVSGAGGGDVGLAFSANPDDLASFRDEANERYDTIELQIDPVGLTVETVDR